MAGDELHWGDEIHWLTSTCIVLPKASRWVSGWWKNVCRGCISETVRYRKLVLGRNIVWGGRCATSWCNLDLTLLQ